MHLLHDVASAHKLSLNVDLGNCGPVWVNFDLAAQLLISKHIYILELLDAVSLQQHGDKATESTLGHFLGTLHEDNHVVVVDPLCESLLELLVGHGSFSLRLEITVWLGAEASAAAHEGHAGNQEWLSSEGVCEHLLI